MKEDLKLKGEDKDALREFAKRVRAVLGARLVALKLFGSKARGDDVPGSDIDVAVVVKEGDVALKDIVLDVAFEVNLAYDVYISPRVIPQSVLEDPVWSITPFLQALEKDGVPL